MDLSGKRILLGVTGGIAAYKSAGLLRAFQKAGARVRVTMTPSATRFIGVETFAVLSREEVGIELFQDGEPGDSWTRHIHWAEWADLYVIAPCTANTLSKIVHGQADNLLTSIALALRGPLLLCPTMDGEMIRHPAVRRNLRLAVEYGFHVLEPETGFLASGLNDTGRLPSEEKILEVAGRILHSIESETDHNGRSGHSESDQDLQQNRPESIPDLPLRGKTVLVTAGPTREHLDPVRFISNPSSGKMGVAMAEAARDLGGRVILLHGPLSIPLPHGVERKSFRSADDLFGLIRQHRDADVVIAAAAVSDYKPADRVTHKIKKSDQTLSLDLQPTPDGLAWLGGQKREGQLLIGFAMETEELEENAEKKLREKNLDWICANQLGGAGSGFEGDENRILLLGNALNEPVREEYSGSKSEVARQILRRIFAT